MNNAVILMVRTVSKLLFKERLGVVGQNIRLSRGVTEPEEELGKYGEKKGMRNVGYE